MAKKPAKAVKEVTKAAPKKETFTYQLEVYVNGTEHKVKTNDVYASLFDFDFPAFIKTDVRFKLIEGKLSSEKVVGVFKGRRVFNNQTALKLMAFSLIKSLH